MKIIILLLTLILFFNIALADELMIPFSCYPKIVQEVFAKHNFKLDLDANDRTPESWGFIKSEGAKYTIFTYRSVTKDELALIINIIWEVEKEQSKEKK